MHSKAFHREAPSQPQLTSPPTTTCAHSRRVCHVTRGNRNDGTKPAANPLGPCSFELPTRQRRRAFKLQHLRPQAGPDLWLPPSAGGGKDHGGRSTLQDTEDDAAAKLEAFCAALQPEIDDEGLQQFVGAVPEVMAMPPAEVRSRLDELASSTGLDLATVASLISLVPIVWARPPPALAAQVSGLSKELALSPQEVASLLAAVPPILSISQPTIIKDRLETLGDRLRVRGGPGAAAKLVMRQPVLWSVPPQHVQCGVPAIASALAISDDDALSLVARVPVVVSLEPRLLRLQVGPLAATLGVPKPLLLELLGRSLGLIAVPAEVLGAALENLGGNLGVGAQGALQLVLEQPALLASQMPVLIEALDALEEGLRPQNGRAGALEMLCKQPALVYDTTMASLKDRLDALAKVFQVPVAEMRTLAIQQPALLVIAPYTVRAALQAFVEQGLQDAKRVGLALLVESPGAFLGVGYLAGDVLESWSVRLGLEQQDVAELVAEQPALLEMSPNTVKARLESLAALLGVPLHIATALVRRHPALACAPPNATITRFKSSSMAFSISMQTAGVLLAKAPALLCCTAGMPGELNRDLQPHVDDVSQVVAAYEFYTMEWLQRSMKEAAPQRMTSFSQIDAR